MTIVFDNYNYHYPQLKSPWGFSAYLDEYHLLFDTGSNGRLLLENIKILNIDIKEISYIFISHSHWDHIGGLDSILELNPDITLFVPESLSKHLIKDLNTLAKEVIVITEKPQRLFDTLYTTGLLGEDMPEQSLIINGEKPTLITGCGHFGISNIVNAASQIIGKKIHLAVGGFHLMYSNKDEITDNIVSLKKSGVTYVCPTHCSGDQAIAMFAQSFGDHYIQGGIGAKIEI